MSDNSGRAAAGRILRRVVTTLPVLWVVVTVVLLPEGERIWMYQLPVPGVCVSWMLLSGTADGLLDVAATHTAAR